MHNDPTKMSKIMEHLHNDHTDQLYRPLRNALNKSGVPLPYGSRQSLTPQKLESSNITHSVKLLSAFEADKIRTTTFAADKELVPTHHLDKVAGKHFYAVDIEQRVGAPLTSSQFQKQRRNNVEQIVYQYKDAEGNPIPFPQFAQQIYQSYAQDGGEGVAYGQSYDRVNMARPYQDRVTVNQHSGQRVYESRPVSYKVGGAAYPQNPTRMTYQPFAQLNGDISRTYLEPKQGSPKANNASPRFVQEKTDISIPFTQERTFISQPNTSYEYQNTSAFQAYPSAPQDTKILANRPLSQQSNYDQPQNSQFEHSQPQYLLMQQKKPTLVGVSPADFNKDANIIPKKTKVRARAPEHVRSQSQLSGMAGSGVKSYRFDKKMTASKNRTQLQAHKKTDYKYNLFSILDQAGNQGCKSGSCTSGNELVAARRNKVQWNS